MKPGRSKDVVAAAALLGALGLGAFLFLRARGALGVSWTDGARRFASETGTDVRHAVWDAPEGWPELGDAHDPALSPDGRWLVFASGERGLNSELFAAELVDGVPRDPRPLAELNSPADELAPAFGDGTLWFASDRAGGAGGLDLLRAPYADGAFGPVERLEPGLNSSADESDPAPLSGSRTLLFASDRARHDFDLYAATPDADGFFALEPLAVLNGPGEEREPALARDGRSLYFASDRAGAGFELYRALRFVDGWQAPAPVPELGSALDERGPWLSADGFALLFERRDEHGAGLLARARSLELFRVPPPAVTLAQWLTLLALLVLALLALLAKRWRALDILYKCFLVSLILHLLLMLYLRTVAPEGQSYDTGPGPGAEPSFRVRRAPDERASGLQARLGTDGLAEPERAQLAPRTERAAAPALAALPAPERGEEVAPAADALEPALEPPQALALAEREQPLERYQGEAPGLALAARASGERGAPSRAEAGPERAESGPAALDAAAPAAARLAATEAARDELARGAPRGETLARAEARAPATDLAAPRERFERAGGNAPELALAAPAAAARESATGSAPAPLAAATPTAGAPARPQRSAGALPLSPAGGAPGPGEAEAPARERLVATGPAAASGAAPEMRAPAGDAARPTAVASTDFDAIAGLTPAAAPRRDAGTSAAPARAPAAAPSAAAPRAAPPGPSAGALADVPVSTPSAPAPERAHAGSATGSALASAQPELRAPAETPGASAGGAPSASFDAIAGLAPAAAARRAETEGPARAASPGPEAQVPRAAPAGPDPRTLAPAAAADSPAAPGFARSSAPAGEALAGAQPELRAPAGETSVARPAAAPSASFDAIAGLAPAAAARRAGTEGPARAASPGAVAPRAAPAGPAPQALAPAAATDTPAAPGFARSSAPAGEALAGAQPELRAPAGETSVARPAAAPSASFDATAGLAAASAVPARAVGAPERAAVAPERSEAPARPAPSALAVPEAAPRDELERASAPRLSATPYQNRFGAQKLRALEEFGGSQETEHAVAAGLAYLARIQGANGEWGERSDAHQKYLDVRIGKSALALLAFLGAGHVPGGSTEHAAAVEKTMLYLLAAQDVDTGHFGRSCSYGHGIATYALAECFALTKDERLRAPLARAVAEIVRHQHAEDDPRLLGGWGYYFADGHVWNGDEWPRTSVTAWQVMALESARLSGLAVPDEAFANARTFLLNTWDPRARAFRYDHDPERLSSAYPILPASTPAALFALSLVGVDAGANELAAARRFVLTRMPDGYRYTGDDDFVQHARGNLYFWYYATLAMFRVGGNEWERWNAALKETLLPAQEEDGSWRPIDTYAEYAGDEDGERTYTTAMCVLSLEIYYRYFTPLLQVR